MMMKSTMKMNTMMKAKRILLEIFKWQFIFHRMNPLPPQQQQQLLLPPPPPPLPQQQQQQQQDQQQTHTSLTTTQEMNTQLLCRQRGDLKNDTELRFLRL